MMINKDALKESLSDTVIATVINFPLNYVLIAISLWLGLEAFAMAVFMTSVLFVIAIVRKYFVRTWYAKRSYND